VIVFDRLLIIGCCSALALAFGATAIWTTLYVMRNGRELYPLRRNQDDPPNHGNDHACSLPTVSNVIPIAPRSPELAQGEDAERIDE
jgi:hypothetical protein